MTVAVLKDVSSAGHPNTRRLTKGLKEHSLFSLVVNRDTNWRMRKLRKKKYSRRSERKQEKRKKTLLTTTFPCFFKACQTACQKEGRKEKRKREKRKNLIRGGFGEI